MEKELFFGMGRGYMLAALILVGGVAIMLTLVLKGVAIGVAEKWLFMYTTFTAPILAIVVVPKEAAKIFTKKKETK